MNSHQKTKLSLLYLFYRKMVKKVNYNDIIERLQTSVFYFSYNISTIACNTTPTLFWESKLQVTAWAACDFLVTELLLKTQARVLRTSSVTKIKCWRGKQKIWTGLNQTKHFRGLEQGLHGKKRTETMINYFNVSNSTSFKSKLIFVSRNSYFLWLMVKWFRI